MTSLWRHLSLTSIAYDWRRKLETGSRLTTGAYTPPTRLNSTVESRRRRRCVLGISEHEIDWHLTETAARGTWNMDSWICAMFIDAFI